MPERLLRVHALGELSGIDSDFYRNVLEFHPLPAWIYDPVSLNFLQVNAAAVAEYGYSEEEFLAMRISDIGAKADIPAMVESMRAQTGSRTTTGPWTYRRKDGTRLRVTVYCQDLKLRGRNARLVIVNDISEREHLEQQLRLLAAAVEGAANAVMITDAEMELPGPNIVFVNAAFTRMTGYKPDEIIGRNPSLLGGPKPELICFQQIRRDLVTSGSVSFEVVNYRKDGTDYQVEWHISPLRDESGKVTHYLSLQNDVTDRNRLRDQFHQSQKMEAIGQLAGGIAHDFNNLLTIILGYCGLLAGEVGSASGAGKKQLHGLEEIQRAAEKAAALTAQLLAFSRKQVLRTRVMDLNPVISHLENMLRRLIGENIDLELVLDPSIGRVNADPGQVEQALMNLAVNARDAMPRGGMLTIETRNADISARYAAISSLQAGQYVLLSVTDSGQGMDEATRSRVFEPFFTTKEAGKGTGLGLSMVYGFVKQIGGTIGVYSEPNRGACFKIYLPRTSSAVEESKPPVPGHTLRGSGVILVVEDEKGICELIREVLVTAGYEVYTASNAREAIAVARARKSGIDLLLTDVVLPGVGGPELAEQVQALHPALKVLFASGYSDHALLRQGALEHGSAFVQKPFDTDTLLAKIAQLLLPEVSSITQAS